MSISKKVAADSDETQYGAAADLRSRILDLVEEYSRAAWLREAFDPGASPVPVSGRVFDHEEVRTLVDASLDFWLTAGRFSDQFEREFARWMGTRKCLLVNSGSSANLVAISTLTSPKLGPKTLRPGDEVITCATGFPTTVNPIVQNGLIPVFVDVQMGTYNMESSLLAEARTDRTKAIMVAHTLGNPFDVGAIVEFARKHDLWLIEDMCDAVGSEYDGKKIGTFGNLATVSFYPAHHMTMGEGGAVLTRSPRLAKIAESFRDWGRDCWCAPGCENTCGKRFEWKLGDLPEGYDHKYIYSHRGYNLKVTDMQAAVGVAQLKKLPHFVASRRRNFDYLYGELTELADQLILPRWEPRAQPSWFGFPITVRPDGVITRDQLTAELNEANVATRLIFAGNLVRQPAYRHVPYRVVGDLANADIVMRDSFWVGVYPGLGDEELGHIAAVIKRAVKGRRRRR